MLARLSVLLGKISPTLGELWGIQLYLFLLVIVLTAVFLVGYLLQGTRVAIELRAALRGIRTLSKAGKHVDPGAVAKVLTPGPLTHLWAEYSDTLHRVRRAADGGMAPATDVRATVPAEMFFTRDALVDGRLFEDFTRHLPGVLTGLGIIGTFAGLLEGLSRFDATSSTTAVAGLKALLDGVAHAFTTSAIAIGCAMLIVFISKFVLAIFYKQVESLNHLIDSLYTTGAGEEYLSRLVLSTEKSDSHVADLKKELIEEFARLLSTLSDRQLAADVKNTQALGAYVGEALRSSLAQISDRRYSAAQNTDKVIDGKLSGAPLDDTSAGFSQTATTLNELDAPVAKLLSATLQSAAALQDIQSVLAALRKN